LSHLFCAALLLGAFLLFVLEPMAGRRFLPVFGGSPAVWTTCMLFFQAGLLAGYAYVHVATVRLGLRRQAALHVGLVLVGLVMLWAEPFQNSGPSAWSLVLHPSVGVIGVLLRTVGLPFFVAATTAPLLQRWFAATGHPRAGDPYFLYVQSNAGSLLGLLAYPLVIEPKLDLRQQERFWAIGYALLATLVLGCAFAVARSESKARGEPAVSHHPCAGSWLRWVGLAFVPSSLLLGVTTALTTDVAPVPLLWVVPLALYLTTFMLVFARRQVVPHALMVRLLPVAVMALAPVVAAGLVQPFWIPLHLVTFFVAAMVCHGALARLRPGTEELTAYYLAIAVGGALGGVFNALIAPVVFDHVAEYPLGLVLACLCLPGAGAALMRGQVGEAFVPLLIGVLIAGLVRNVGGLAESSPGAFAVMLVAGLVVLVTVRAARRPLRFALAVGAVLLGLGLSEGVDGPVLHRERTFFGVLRVTEAFEGEARFHRLFQGTTLHGQQCLEPGRRREPLAYFARTGPIGQVFEVLHARPAAEGARAPLRVAVVGLGAGTLAAYARPRERWTFYEIDPAVVRIARDPRAFTYIQESRAGSIGVDVGDARLRLHRATEHGFDLLVLDAFSSDAIPTHLLTRDAFRVYRAKVAERGLIAVHLSNRMIDLDPVVGRLAEDAGLSARVRYDGTLTAAERRAGKSASIWAVLAAQPAELGSIVDDPRWRLPRVERGDRVWTDDWSSIVGHLRLGWRRDPERPHVGWVSVAQRRATHQRRGGLRHLRRLTRPTTDVISGRSLRGFLDQEAPALLFEGPGQQAGAGVYGIDMRRWRAREPAQLDHRADQGVEFQRPAVLDVLEHRGLVLADRLGARDAALERHAEVGAEFLADGLSLGHHRGGQRPARGEPADAGQRGVRQGADRVEAQVAPELEPDLGADVLEHRRLEPGLLEQLGELLDARGLRTVELAHRKPVALNVADHPGSHQLGGRVDDAADDAVDGDAGGDDAPRVDGLDPRPFVRPAQALKVPPGDAVLHGHDDRVRAEQAAHLLRHRRHLVGLHGGYHDVVHASLGDPVGCLRRIDEVLGAVLHDQLEALFPDGLEVRAAADECHVLARQRELDAEHAADRARSNNADFHAIILRFCGYDAGAAGTCRADGSLDAEFDRVSCSLSGNSARRPDKRQLAPGESAR
jgi:hypothetical protein